MKFIVTTLNKRSSKVKVIKKPFSLEYGLKQFAPNTTSSTDFYHLDWSSSAESGKVNAMGFSTEV